MARRRIAIAGLLLVLVPVAGAFTNAERFVHSSGPFYLFSRLDMPADRYTEELVPLFDETLTFEGLEAYLGMNEIPYSISNQCNGLDEFPGIIKDHLRRFKLGDNLVIRGEGGESAKTAIFKIAGIFTNRDECKAPFIKLEF